MRSRRCAAAVPCRGDGAQVLLKTLSETNQSNAVIQLALEVLAEICSAPPGATEAQASAAQEQFAKFMLDLVSIFAFAGRVDAWHSAWAALTASC